MLRIALSCALAGLGVLAHAQEPRLAPRDLPREQLVDWYFAATFGTGVYTIDGRTVFAFRVPLSYRLREPDAERWGIKLKAPVTVGLYDLDKPLDDVLSQNFATLSVLPGVEFDRRVTERWLLRPTASFGFGQDVVNGVSARIWEVGVRSLYTVPRRGLEFSLGNALLYAGSRTGDDVRSTVGVFSTGLNFVMPLGKNIGGKPGNFGLHFVHYLFFNRLDFIVLDEQTAGLRQQYEIAASVGTYSPIDILGFRLDRVGVSFLTGEGFSAVRFITGFLY
jgi:hypothetical protein